MVCLVNVNSVDWIIYSIFYRFNLEWKIRTLEVLHKQLDVTLYPGCFTWRDDPGRIIRPRPCSAKSRINFDIANTNDGRSQRAFLL
jgi:hypothetical protein